MTRLSVPPPASLCAGAPQGRAHVRRLELHFPSAHSRYQIHDYELLGPDYFIQRMSCEDTAAPE